MKKVYLETFGCQMNVSDSERTATLLEQQGYEIIPTEESADIILFNTCSVREKAEHKLYTRVGQVRNSVAGKQLVGVMGCVAQLEGDNLFARNNPVDFVIGTKAVGRIHEVIEKVSQEKLPFADLGERDENYDWSVAARHRQSPHVAFVPIIEGCNKFCTYCIVPFSRGREKSLPSEEIIRHIGALRSQGIKEVHLIGQNVNSYRPLNDEVLSRETGATAFSRLLRAVARTGIERIKFATSFPRDFHPDIVDAIDEFENLCNWVHLPVQSGSDRVLKAMRRGHTAESYKRRIDAVRNSPRKISLTTDIIVGFPGETDEDFRQTCDLVRYCEYDSAYIYKYSVREGTPAAGMADDVPPEVKTERFRELELIQKSIQMTALEALIGTSLEVLAEYVNKKTAGELGGHSTCQKVVNFPASPDLLGQIINVRITQTKGTTLYGEAI